MFRKCNAAPTALQRGIIDARSAAASRLRRNIRQVFLFGRARDRYIARPCCRFAARPHNWHACCYQELHLPETFTLRTFP